MIKVKLTDSNNMKCFSGLIHTKDSLRDYSIDITDSDDYDYEFVHANEFVNLSLPLQESVDYGIENYILKSIVVINCVSGGIIFSIVWVV